MHGMGGWTGCRGWRGWMVIIGQRSFKSTFGANSLKMLTISKFKHHPHCLFAWNIVWPAQYLQQLEGRTYSCIFQRTLSETEFELNQKVSFFLFYHLFTSLHLDLCQRTNTHLVSCGLKSWRKSLSFTLLPLCTSAETSLCSKPAIRTHPCVQNLLFRDLPACNPCFSETSLCARPVYQRPVCVQNLLIRHLPLFFSETSLCARPAYQRHLCVQNLPIRDLPVCNPWLSETYLCSKPAIHRPACV